MRALGALLLMVLAVGCGPAYIQGTEIPDTAENRAILDAVEAYRAAVEARDVDALSAIVSRQYFENAATTGDTKDDYGQKELLKRVLPILRDNVRSVVYKIQVTKVAITGNEASAFVEYELTFQIQEAGQEAWATSKDKNRLDFVKEDGRWKVLSGM